MPNMLHYLGVLNKIFRYFKMKPLYVTFVAVLAVFMTWFFMKHKENFTTNFQPDDQGMEQTIHGYGYYFGDKKSDLDTYFGFRDDISAGFSKRLLPDVIPYDDPVNKS
ncbi:hypothetical protein PBCVCVB1_805R [Paramecium bursaria Chlorella virus CVB-1]|nr:hypothetical protein PBCVCVB1_805R [Paramecium bursaria Chlorella virus CVB-1]